MAARRYLSFVVCAIALLAGGTAQNAQAQNWDGSGLVRFGVFLQGSFIDYDIAQTSAAGATSNFSASPDGGGVGLSAGYDLRLGSFVVGVEADASFDDGGARSRPATQEQYGIDFFSTVRGRLGYVINPAFMIYGTAGYSMLGSEYKQNGLAPLVGGGASIGKKYGTMGGFVYGAGMEYDFGWGTGFLEYLHADMSGWDFTNFQGAQTSINGTQDVVRLGMKFKVGHDYSHDVYKRPGGLK